MIFNDIVKPGTPNPVVKDYEPALKKGQKLQSTFSISPLQRKVLTH